VLKFIFKVVYYIVDDLIHQRKIVSFLKNKKIKIIIDIGAHKGEFLKAVSKIESAEKVYSLEPQKKIYKKLLEKTDAKRNKAYNLAISNKEGQKKLSINKLSMTSTFSKVKKKSKYYRVKKFIVGNQKVFEKVKVKKLDNFVKMIKIKNKIDLLKIDTEGHELEVLKSGIKTLSKVKFILIEFRLNDMYLNYSSTKIHNFLKQNKFKLVKKFKFPLFAMEDRIYKKI
jgi:FkbM family methyltransferase